nr:unnamed protein product [Callosobruchus analis]
MAPETPSSSGSDTSIRPPMSAEERLMVAVRIRPLKPDETTRALYAVDKKHIIIEDSDKFDVTRQRRALDKRYSFDVVFGEDSTQEEVYEVTTSRLVKDVLSGELFLQTTVHHANFRKVDKSFGDISLMWAGVGQESPYARSVMEDISGQSHITSSMEMAVT